jgi:hypothetical protein
MASEDSPDGDKPFMLKITYTSRSLSPTQEEILVGYFQSWEEKMKTAMTLARNQMRVSPSEHVRSVSTNLKNIQEHLEDFFFLGKEQEGVYLFTMNRHLIKGLDMAPLPEQIKRMMFGGPHGLWSKISTRMINDLNKDVRKKMAISKERVVIEDITEH